MPSKLEIAAMVGLGWLLLEKTSKAATKGPTGAKGDADLIKRANQPRATEWVPILVYDLGQSEAVAEAMARWFGIESGGRGSDDPKSVSSAGERGLAQITKTSALKEKPPALTQAEWDSLVSPLTSLQDQARIAIKVIDWCYQRATKYIKVPPIDSIEHLWYAKLYHQSPVEVRDAKLTGDAIADAHRLEGEWAGDAHKLHHLHAANVVAWGSVIPPAVLPHAGARVEVERDGKWLPGVVDPGGLSATLDGSGDSLAIGPGGHQTRAAKS